MLEAFQVLEALETLRCGPSVVDPPVPPDSGALAGVCRHFQWSARNEAPTRAGSPRRVAGE
eukprot:686176-Alexandrium_andersonii.AAC.1